MYYRALNDVMLTTDKKNAMNILQRSDIYHELFPVMQKSIKKRFFNLFVILLDYLLS